MEVALRAEYRRSKQAAEESAYNFAADGVMASALRWSRASSTCVQPSRTSRPHPVKCLSSRESLRLAQLRVQAGVSTQREVVDSQRDVTNAELRYAQRHP